MKLKGLLSATLAALTLAATPVAFATNSVTVSPDKAIVMPGGGGGSTAGAAGNTASATAGADQFASNAGTIVQNARSGASNIGSQGMSVASDIGGQTATNADNFAGTGTNQTGMDLFQVFKRADAVLTDAATNGMSLLLKVLYYTATLSILVSALMIIWALLPWSKMKVWKPIGGLIGGFVFFGIVTSVAGVSILDNPIVNIVRYIFFGG